ncbi:MAG TPA: heavy metal translocating P-type ATPase [Opitutales bacterium]|nr:heavy metal translocating P-type ATPase [Opitutales bacterium]
MNTAKTFLVRGMHCASCASIVERALRQRASVSSAEVSYTGGTAKVSYDDAQVQPQDLAALIEPLGYSLVTDREGTPAQDAREESAAEVEALRRRVLWSAPMAAMAIGVMGWHGLAEMHAVPAMGVGVHSLLQALLAVMAAFVLFFIGAPYLQALGRFARHGVANMDTLIGLGTGAAFVYSLVLAIFAVQLQPYLEINDGYFDVTIVVITFVTLGKYLEAQARRKTGDALESLLGLQVKHALVMRDGKELEVPIEQVKPGDVLTVKPGTKIPVDGVLVEGASHVDESLVTGEPIPVKKAPGDSVMAGTINTTGAFTFRATKVGGETLLAHIIALVREAQSSKAPVQSLADKIAAVFVPAVLGIATLALALWLLLGAGTLGFPHALTLGLSSFVCVLVVACPCALGLATPAAVTVAVGQGARAGILIKDAATLQKLREVQVVVVDKTGTLTRGRPELIELRDLKGRGVETTLALLAALEKNSEHPLARAIVTAASTKNILPKSVSGFEALKGRGVAGVVDEVEYFAGSERLAGERGFDTAGLNLDEETRAGRTPIILGSAHELLAVALVADAPKESALSAVHQLHALGMRVVMLTGDNENTARHIALLTGIDEVFAQTLPADKLAKIKELQADGTVVAMAGDGVNDAPALAQADVGIAMGDGADAAIETAGVALLHGDLAKLVQAIQLSRMTIRIIRQNLFWAFIFNLIGLPLAAGVFYPWLGWTLSPMFAGAAMAFSSVAVVTNALRLKGPTLIAKPASVLVFHLGGMHCQSCVRLAETELRQVPGVTAVSVSLAQQTAEITGDLGNRTPEAWVRELNPLMQKHEFELSLAPVAHGVKWAEFAIAVPVAVVLMAAFLFAQKLGIGKWVDTSQMGYGVAFFIGVVASLSSCMAIVGGLALSLSAYYARKGEKTRPQLLFHSGRLVSFFVLGGVAGAVGSIFQFGPLGAMMLGMLAGGTMLVLGIGLLNVFPWAARFQAVLPHFLGDRVHALQGRRANVMPLLLGAATFFLPCGFTQSMQLYTLTTGNFLTGALTMFSFALGTLPVLALLSFSALGTRGRGQSGVFFKTAGLLVVFFGVYDIINSLAGYGVIPPLFNF